LLGGILYLIQYGGEQADYKKFKGEPAVLTQLGAIVKDAWSFDGKAIIQFGLLLLLATPVARVAFSVFAFALRRDWLYVVITLVVLGILLLSLFGGSASAP
jgi:uncharacterized membrane protein